ncbi:alpha/beta hydrolase [Antrihabitans cavernicola]|uniref:Alpha/beta hydrolase n=1 Tax=Antrihabitans cavernicola TaxID=2495913 RepID=A0A5A7S5K5_9NOCA|nr:alpha/beta hydrolase [Spelaeibacter cavernicola]
MSSLDEWIAGGEHATLTGHRVFYRQDGPVDGRPVTLVHGFPTSSHDWEPIVPALVEAGCRVTTLDLLGFGASDKPQGHDYRIAEQATIVESLWTHLGITGTALVAHDYGVSVAQELLARDSARVSRMAWLNGGLYSDLYRPLLIQRVILSPIGSILVRGMTETSYRASLRKTLGRPISDEDFHEMWRSTSSNDGIRVQHPLMRYIGERKANAQRWQHAHESYPGPTLFVWGPVDPISGRHVLPRLRERLPQAKIVVLDDDPATGHYPHVENPTAVAAALAPFLGA